MEIKDDLTYVKYYKSEELTYELRETPESFDVEKEYSQLRENAISSSIDGKIISTSSKIIYDNVDFQPKEEITINYE